MIRARLASLRFLLYALMVLAGGVCALELGLRVNDSYQHQQALVRRAKSELIVRSWRVHHEMQPMRTVQVSNPDTGKPITLRTNSFGLRGPEPVLPKPPGTWRVLCLGDETLLAPELEEQQIACSRLQELLQPRTPMQVEVINAGVDGYCPLLSCIQLKQTLLALQPDLVLLHFDMTDVADDFRYRRLTTMGENSDPLACPHPGLEPSPRIKALTEAEPFLIPQWLREQIGSLSSQPPRTSDDEIDSPTGRFAWLRDQPPDWSVYRQQAFLPIARIQQIAADSYARFLLVTSPAPWQVSAEASNGPKVRKRAGVPEGSVYRSRKPFELLAEFAGRHAIAFYDASAAFQNAESPAGLFLKNSPGFSAAGHELFAGELVTAIIQQMPEMWHRPGASPGERLTPLYDGPTAALPSLLPAPRQALAFPETGASGSGGGISRN